MENSTVKIGDLMGKTFEFRYASEIYHITIQSDETLLWELKKGEFEGPSSGTESYIHSELYPGVHFISWTEATGLVLCNVIDFNTMVLTTHGNHDGEMFVNPGTISRISKPFNQS